MLTLTHASLATIDELFRYKSRQFRLDDFPGYTDDQWGIKAHNRPWIEEHGRFAKGQKVIEVGGGYSLLVKHLSEKYELEAWIGDDFGAVSGEHMWARWGDPSEWERANPEVRYVLKPFGSCTSEYPGGYFDRIFTVSTLEHIPGHLRLAVLKDMHRCLTPGGKELHTIDVPTTPPQALLQAVVTARLPLLSRIWRTRWSDIRTWVELIRASGVRIDTSIPPELGLLDRRVLVESPDVVYRFYPPNNEPKPYSPAASLLLVIEDR